MAMSYEFLRGDMPDEIAALQVEVEKLKEAVAYLTEAVKKRHEEVFDL